MPFILVKSIYTVIDFACKARYLFVIVLHRNAGIIPCHLRPSRRFGGPYHPDILNAHLI